jgi:hypothetical protein
VKTFHLQGYCGIGHTNSVNYLFHLVNGFKGLFSKDRCLHPSTLGITYLRPRQQQDVVSNREPATCLNKRISDDGDGFRLKEGQKRDMS